MKRNKGIDLDRRFLLIAAGGIFLPRWTWAENQSAPILSWELQERGDVARETISGKEDPIASRTGHAIWVGNGRERALRLDGYSVWISHLAPGRPLSSGSLTLSAWLALESYPVNDAAIVQMGNTSDAEVDFSVDKWGYLKLTVRDGDAPIVCRSTRPITKASWTHVAGTIGGSGIRLYIDGQPQGRTSGATKSLRFPSDVNLSLGKSSGCPVIADIFPTGVLNGLIRNVRVYDEQLAEASIAKVGEESRSDVPPDLQINGNWCSEDPQRPVYHALPPRAWTNEPHGLIHWGGQFHLFYQKNPNGPFWSHINWGHMTSPDLYRWTEMPVALFPEPGPDSEGCWSGSVIDHRGKLAIIYTGGDGHRSTICLALSDDGIHFTKYAGNPIIPAPPTGQGFPEFRDPYVWRDGDTYYLIIGSAITGKGGTALLYRSKDLINWEYRKPLLVGDRETSGVFWEMPVFVKVGEQHALIVCEVPGRASYWVGTWKDETFTPRTRCPQRLELFNHLLSPTPHVLNDGRVITMGIIPDERSPKECWRAGWAHLYSLPRLISADENGRLHQIPFDGIGRWSEPVASLSNITLTDGSMMPIEQASGRCFNLRAIFSRGESRSITLRLRSSQDGSEYTDIRYYWEIGRLVLDRSHSSLNASVRRDSQDATFFPDQSGVLQLDVFLDESVLEVFVDQRSAFATRIYPTLDASTGIFAGSEGTGANIDTITIARIRRPQ